MQELTVFADNVLPACLAAHNIIKVPEKAQDMIDRGLDMSDTSFDTLLRAAAVQACDCIIKQAKDRVQSQLIPGESLLPCELDFYLWSLAKTPSIRSKNRLKTKKTVYF